MILEEARLDASWSRLEPDAVQLKEKFGDMKNAIMKSLGKFRVSGMGEIPPEEALAKSLKEHGSLFYQFIDNKACTLYAYELFHLHNMCAQYAPSSPMTKQILDHAFTPMSPITFTTGLRV